MTGPVRVVVADDDYATRVGIRTIIEAEADIEVVGQAATGLEAYEMAVDLRPDVVLMDIQMPDLDGVEATRRITAAVDADDEHPRVIVLTTYDVDEYVFRSLRAGASAFLLKRVGPEELIDAIHVVARGDALPAAGSTRRFIERWSTPEAVAAERWVAVNELTEREREVLVHIARGLTNAEIAAELYVSSETVRTHVKRVYQKVGARDRAQAVIAAYETGIVTRGDV
jgi:DNA-binding NarL/FixJ family response regulator